MNLETPEGNSEVRIRLHLLQSFFELWRGIITCLPPYITRRNPRLTFDTDHLGKSGYAEVS